MEVDKQSSLTVPQTSSLVLQPTVSILSAIDANVVWRMIGTMHYPFVVPVDSAYPGYLDSLLPVRTQIVELCRHNLRRGEQHFRNDIVIINANNRSRPHTKMLKWTAATILCITQPATLWTLYWATP